LRIIVDSTDKVGGDLYEYIARKSTEDLALGGAILTLAMYMRSEVPLFILKVKYREAVGKNTLGEISKIEEKENGSKVNLESEVDLGDALKTLWSAYGRDRVEQAGRMGIIVMGVKPAELKKLKIREGTVDMAAKISELAARIIPEGLRVRSIKREPGVMTTVAAEDPMQAEWVAIGDGMEVEE
jgi:putative methanogenesis marker protein 17